MLDKFRHLSRHNSLVLSFFCGVLSIGFLSPPVKADSAIYYVNLGPGQRHYFSAFSPSLNEAYDIAFGNCSSEYSRDSCIFLAEVTGGGWVAIAQNSSHTHVHVADSKQIAELEAMNNCWLNSGFSEPCAVVHVYHDTNY